MSYKQNLVLAARGKPTLETLSNTEQDYFYLSLLKRIIELKNERKGNRNYENEMEKGGYRKC